MRLLLLMLLAWPCCSFNLSSPWALRAGPPPRTISLLGLFELTTTTGVARSEGRSELEAARMAVRHINQRTSLLPGLKLHLLTNDTKCDPGVGVDAFFHALYTRPSTKLPMLLGSACSEVTESLAKVTPYWNIVQVAFGSTSPSLSDRREFPLFYRTVAPDSSHNPARLAFVRGFGWDTVTALSQDEDVFSLAVNDLVTELEEANITCTATITFSERDFKDQLRHLRDLDTRIIIASFSHQVAPKIFCEAYRLGMYGSDYAWIIQGSPMDQPWWSDAPKAGGCSQAALMAAVEGLLLVSSHNSLVGPEPSLSGLTNAMFEEQFRSQNLPITRYTPQTYDAVWAIAMTLHNTESRRRSLGLASISNFDYGDSHMAHEFLREMAGLEFLGVSGPVSFSGADRVGISAFYQVQGGVVQKVALFYPSSDRLDFECPQCEPLRWQGGQVPIAKREFRLRVVTIERTAFYSVACLAGAGICLATVFLGFNLYFRKLKYIKLSSPRLNNIAVVGCILVYTAVILLGLDHATLPAGGAHFANVCTARAYLLSAGFSLAFGSMFTKTYRVHRIFTSSRSGVVKNKLLQDTQLISLICALLLVDILIVTLWVSVDPMQRHLKNLSLEISAIDRSVVYQPQVEVCRSQHTSGWLGALYVYKGLLLIVGVYMAWETRRVKIPALNDSQYIGMSVYSVVITSGIVVVLANLISERATLAFVTITALILASTSTTLCLLFVPKIHTIWLHPDGDPIVESMGLKIECNTRRFVIDERRERYYRVEVQNKVYRREMAALDVEINKLERMLIEPPPSPSTSASVSHGSVSLPGSLRDDDGMSEGDEADEDSEVPHSPLPRPMPMYNPRGAAALLLSVVPSVVPRASWPCAQAAERQQVTFRSEPELDQATEHDQPSSAAALLKKLLPRIWRPARAKANRSAIAAALRMHVNYVTDSAAAAPSSAPFRERARGSPRFPHRIVPSGLLAPTARTGKCRSLDTSMDAVSCGRCGGLQQRNATSCVGCARRSKPRAASLSPNCDVWCVEQSVANDGELTITIHRTESQCT
ncbi:gamma-aminobutyric acid type B receptor subunit 2 isoform X2 [Neocloeon triangulifer]|uniref:gamma-aminobutyric acid type B receptor subunit 2 isoform X2 n=1 Tax=Neocloeon triangulifer TaxID=2078957 RepID=UPI00286F34DB|nr:gamma-aminobutyric acid type B receptor subunit 2 isoform X2 [Neocloeon triangulifer]